MKFEKTIYALVTAQINQNVAIIRISGDRAFEVTNELIKDKNFLPKHGTVVNKNIFIKDKFIDNVLLLFFKTPNSFTGEDIVEIQLHGSIFLVQKTLNFLESKNLKLADPGEFSRRAFLNNKIDLIQAESINSLILSKTQTMQEHSSSGLFGKISEKINTLRESLLEIIALIEVSVDYPEFDEARNLENKKIKKMLSIVLKQMQKIYNDSEKFFQADQGIKIVIIGKPNVGKSSLLNKILNSEKAIVYNQPGTTRDLVDGNFYLNNILYKIIDTAGIRKTTDSEIEKIGIQKSLEQISQADIVLAIFDNSKKINSNDQKVLEATKNKRVIYILNKNDLDQKSEEKYFENKKVIKISTLDNSWKKVVTEITKITKQFLPNLKSEILIGERQVTVLENAINNLDKVINSIDNNTVLDLLSEDIKEVYNYLGELIGESVQINLLDKIFSKFCLGK